MCSKNRRDFMKWLRWTLCIECWFSERGPWNNKVGSALIFANVFTVEMCQALSVWRRHVMVLFITPFCSGITADRALSCRDCVHVLFGIPRLFVVRSLAVWGPSVSSDRQEALCNSKLKVMFQQGFPQGLTSLGMWRCDVSEWLIHDV